MHTVIVVDDHPFVRASVKVLISKKNFNVIGETGSGQEAMAMIRDLKPELIILDISMPDLDGFEVLHRLSGMTPPVRILVLSSQSAEQFSIRCKNAGAHGYVCKNEELSELSRAAQSVMSGDSHFPALSSVRASDNETKEESRLALVTGREMIVLQYLAKGKSNKQIAESMFLSNKTISTYKTRLFEKLVLNSVVDLADFAKRHGLI